MQNHHLICADNKSPFVEASQVEKYGCYAIFLLCLLKKLCKASLQQSMFVVCLVKVYIQRK